MGVRACVCLCACVCVRCRPQGAWNYGLSPTDDSDGQTSVGEFAYVYISWTPINITYTPRCRRSDLANVTHLQSPLLLLLLLLLHTMRIWRGFWRGINKHFNKLLARQLRGLIKSQPIHAMPLDHFVDMHRAHKHAHRDTCGLYMHAHSLVDR